MIASRHGLDSHASDVDCVKRTLGRVSNPAILVGHSYAGSVIGCEAARGTEKPEKLGFVIGFLLGQEAIWLSESLRILREEAPDVEITLMTKSSPESHMEGTPLLLTCASQRIMRKVDAQCE